MNAKEHQRTCKRPTPFYKLTEVRRLVAAKKVSVERRALMGAWDCFEWDLNDVLAALAKLELKHFYKTNVSKYNPYVVYDFYKARRLNGEDVYTHFYVDDGKDLLIVDSFKRI